jgi:hypothetical protein
MGKIESSEELMKYISNRDRDNSVLQFSIPGKGKFTLVLQEEAEQSIKADVEAQPKLERMIQESRSEYQRDNGMSTSKLLETLSVNPPTNHPSDFLFSFSEPSFLFHQE